MSVTAAAHVRTAAEPHIADVLIAERAPRLTATPWWPLVRPLMYRILNYYRARRMADAIAPMSGADALAYVSQLLSLKVSAQGLEHLPRTGRCVVVCNHPTGIADGVAVYDAFKPLRGDVIFYANADARRVCPRFDEALIPVEWVEAKRNREATRRTLELTRHAMEAERALVVFPAGRISRRAPDGHLCDPAWMPTALSVARKHAAPIIPVHVAGPWSTLFHFFNRFSPELRDITLFHELLNKTGRPFSLLVGAPIPPEALGHDMQAATDTLKHFVERVLPDRGAEAVYG
jgi:putative hemolysin